MAVKLSRILVPLDFSAGSLKAKDYADQIARDLNAEVELLHVVERSPYEVYQQRGFLQDVPLYQLPGDTAPSANQKFIIKDVMEETRQELMKIATSASGVKYRTEVRHGHAVEEILAEIGSYKPDLVVIATQGRRGLTHLVLGSVTEKIVRLSPVPVLTVRGG
jgi:nucleotide-binding universal stress UspA family protein